MTKEAGGAFMQTVRLELEEHPLLELGAFTTRFHAPLGELTTPPWLLELHALEVDAPIRRSEDKRQIVRDLLRHGGYRPTGRGKPASEYLVRAAGEGALRPINLAVDACNAVSLQSGLPISVVDLDLLVPPLRVGLAGEGSSYAFNEAGQEIDLEGLLCLFDSAGPCANAVKDSQRTKTSAATRRTLSLVWGARSLLEDTRAAVAWYRELLERTGEASTGEVER